MTLVNISVFVIWIPARLQASESFIRINRIWDPIEKVIYLLIDGCLNAYFLYLVHSNLVSAGMTKVPTALQVQRCHRPRLLVDGRPHHRNNEYEE